MKTIKILLLVSILAVTQAFALSKTQRNILLGITAGAVIIHVLKPHKNNHYHKPPHRQNYYTNSHKQNNHHMKKHKKHSHKENKKYYKEDSRYNLVATRNNHKKYNYRH